MNDDEMLATMRRSLVGVTESLTDVHLDRSADAIRGRARGRRVVRGLAGAGTGGLALGLGLGLAFASGGGSAPGARPVHVNLDAWSVNTLPSGRVYVDIRELRSPALLRETLADAGVPAVVTFGEFCTGPSGGLGQSLHQILGKTAVGGQPRLTIDPARIPAGSKLSIGIVTVTKGSHRGLDASFALVRSGAHLTCGQPAMNPNHGAGKTGPAGQHGDSSAGNGTAKTGLGS